MSEKKRTDKLSSRIDDLTQKNEELRKEELDFKSTLVAAQKFTDEVKRKTEEEARELKRKTGEEVKELRRKTEEEVSLVKRKSEKEAKDAVENARGRAERLKQETYKELAHYPAQIDKLRKTKKKVKEELEGILKRSLDGLEIFSEGEGDKQKSKDYKELFKDTKQDPKKPEKSDDYESINMEFNLPEKNKPKVEEKFSMKDTMKNQGGGIT